MRILFLAAALLMPLLQPDRVEAQADRSQEAIARQLLSEDRAEQFDAAMRAQRLRPEGVGPELRTALITVLEQETALRRERWEASQRGESLEPLTDDLYGSVTQAVVGLRDPRAIPALAEAVGTGLMIMRALVEFGDEAARAVLDVVTSREVLPHHVPDALLALRLMIEHSDSLSPTTIDRIRGVAERRLEGDQGSSGVTLRRAIDLAVVLDDPDLRRIVRALASDADEVKARGVTDPETVERVQKQAADRLAGVPPLPRH